MYKRNKFPIGEQNFKSLRERDAYYVDKTGYIEQLVSSDSKYYFLARPRRFGKSLFLSTLESFFKGERRLFKGLYIDTVKWVWEAYPVLRLDLNTNRYDEQGLLDAVLDNLFREWEKEYGVEIVDQDYSQRFKTIIKAAHEKTGRQVVILVDEYDKPLVGNLNKDTNFEHYRAKLASIYSNFKSSAEHIRLVFLTGVSRFSKLSVFSDLNNLNDITFANEFADVCGITERELLDYFSDGIQELADEMKMTYEEAFQRLKDAYDGYRFAPKGSDIYNPWSLFNCLEKRWLLNYWSQTGGASFIAECLRNMDADLEEVLNTQCNMQDLIGLDLKNADPIALLYQTGYVTIKDCDFSSGLVRLGVPNNEVKDDLARVLLPMYVKIRRGSVEGKIRDLIASIKLGDPEKLMKTLEAFLSGITYEMKMDNENNFQNAVYVLLTLIGANSKVEERTSQGRIDLTIETPKFVYVVEMKIDGTAREALDQIEERGYARKFLADPRRIFRIGVSFSSKTRTIEDYLIEE